MAYLITLIKKVLSSIKNRDLDFLAKILKGLALIFSQPEEARSKGQRKDEAQSQITPVKTMNLHVQTPTPGSDGGQGSSDDEEGGN